MLRHTTESIRSNLRSYDLVIRFGGDEFVCGLVDMSIAEPRDRFAKVKSAMDLSDRSEVTVGLAERRMDESVPDLIARRTRSPTGSARLSTGTARPDRADRP